MKSFKYKNKVYIVKGESVAITKYPATTYALVRIGYDPIKYIIATTEDDKNAISLFLCSDDIVINAINYKKVSIQVLS